MNNENAIMLWRAPERRVIPVDAVEPKDFVPYAIALRPAEQHRVVDALAKGFYDLAAEFVWTRSLARLKSTLGSLGMGFVGEMLGRSDITAFSTPESALTDYDAIRLAEQLGVLSEMGALRLRHGFELLSFIAKGSADDSIDPNESLSIVRACVQYVLAEKDLGAAMDFVRLRDRLMRETILPTDPQFQQLITSPLFFVRTVLRVLMSLIKDGQGSVLDHALGNAVGILPSIWRSIGEDDRWSVGQTYADVVSTGKARSMSGLREVLLLVAGFDYVPENLRSNTFRQAARAVLDAHFGFNNFFNEEPPVRHLGQLGSVIPQPAFIPCVQALLAVALGNSYGASYSASPEAIRQLSAVGAERLLYYYDRVLDQDDVLLTKLLDSKPAVRFCTITQQLLLNAKGSSNPFTAALTIAAGKGQSAEVQALAKLQLNQMRHQSLKH